MCISFVCCTFHFFIIRYRSFVIDNMCRTGRTARNWIKENLIEFWEMGWMFIHFLEKWWVRNNEISKWLWPGSWWCDFWRRYKNSFPTANMTHCQYMLFTKSYQSRRFYSNFALCSNSYHFQLFRRSKKKNSIFIARTIGSSRKNLPKFVYMQTSQSHS